MQQRRQLDKNTSMSHYYDNDKHILSGLSLIFLHFLTALAHMSNNIEQSLLIGIGAQLTLYNTQPTLGI